MNDKESGQYAAYDINARITRRERMLFMVFVLGLVLIAFKVVQSIALLIFLVLFWVYAVTNLLKRIDSLEQEKQKRLSAPSSAFTMTIVPIFFGSQDPHGHKGGYESPHSRREEYSEKDKDEKDDDEEEDGDGEDEKEDDMEDESDDEDDCEEEDEENYSTSLSAGKTELYDAYIELCVVRRATLVVVWMLVIALIISTSYLSYGALIAASLIAGVILMTMLYGCDMVWKQYGRSCDLARGYRSQSSVAHGICWILHLGFFAALTFITTDYMSASPRMSASHLLAIFCVMLVISSFLACTITGILLRTGAIKEEAPF